MSEMPHSSAASTCRSAGVSKLLTAWSRMWVSRFSIPLDPGREQVVGRVEDHSWNAADQISTGLANRDQSGYRMPVPGNQNSVGRQILHQRQALLAEFANVYFLSFQLLCRGHD